RTKTRRDDLAGADRYFALTGRLHEHPRGVETRGRDVPAVDRDVPAAGLNRHAARAGAGDRDGSAGHIDGAALDAVDEDGVATQNHAGGGIEHFFRAARRDRTAVDRDVARAAGVARATAVA